MRLIKRLFMLIVIFTTLIHPYLLLANEKLKCSICGMNLINYCHTEYIVFTKDGEQFRTCGVQCGLTLEIRLGNRFKKAMATALLSHKKIDAEDAFYVFKSSVVTDMAPGFIAFKRKKDAERFSEAFGGKVLTYKEALQTWKGIINR